LGNLLHKAHGAKFEYFLNPRPSFAVDIMILKSTIMQTQRQRSSKNKNIFTALFIIGLMLTGAKVFSQSPPAGPPPPPPSPAEVFNKINPFKKKKKDTAKAPLITPAPAPGTTPPQPSAAPAKGPGGPPPPPPNPLDLFKKKKKKDTVKAAPAHQ